MSEIPSGLECKSPSDLKQKSPKELMDLAVQSGHKFHKAKESGNKRDEQSFSQNKIACICYAALKTDHIYLQQDRRRPYKSTISVSYHGKKCHVPIKQTQDYILHNGFSRGEKKYLLYLLEEAQANPIMPKNNKHRSGRKGRRKGPNKV